MFNRQFLSVLTDDLIFTVDKIKAIMKLEKLDDKDLAQYYTITNVWCAMAAEYSPWTGGYLVDSISRFGLMANIREANKVSKRLINALPDIDSVIDDLLVEGNTFGLILDEIRTQSSVTSRFSHAKAVDHDFEVSLPEIMLQLLRFPRRFTLIESPTADDALKEFRSWDNRNKLRDRVENPYLPRLKSILDTLVPWRRINAQLRKVWDPCMPQGTTAEGYKTWGEKFNALIPFKRTIFGCFPVISARIKAPCHAEFFVRKEHNVARWCHFDTNFRSYARKLSPYWVEKVTYCIPAFWHAFEEPVITYHKVNPKGTVAKLAAVPKSLDESRVIAMENIASQSKAIAYLPVWYKYTDALNIHILDQEINGLQALVGSLEREQENPLCPCTIDSHKASDSITKGQIRSIFNPEYLSIVEEVLPICYLLKGKPYTLYGAATSGNALTFIHECLFFLAVGIESCLIAAPFTFAETWTVKDALQHVHVVGDDLIVPAFAYDTALDLLQKLGIVANADKSYGPGSCFRESCGYDALDGTVISSHYWPRRPIKGSVVNSKVVFESEVLRDYDPSTLPGDVDAISDTTSSLIGLQRGLYRTFPKASIILGQILLKSNNALVSRPAPVSENDIIGTNNTKVKEYVYMCPIPDVSGKTKTYHLEERRFVLQRVARPVVEWVLASKPGSDDYELLRYAAWLYNGPEYFDPVCELAKCSRPSTYSLEKMFGTPTIKWRRSYE